MKPGNVIAADVVVGDFIQGYRVTGVHHPTRGNDVEITLEIRKGLELKFKFRRSELLGGQ